MTAPLPHVWRNRCTCPAAGDMTTSSLADTVLEVVWIDGTGKVHKSKKGNPEFAAFNGGLGVFGVMTELLIQMTPPTNTQLITVTNKDDKLMADINRLLKVPGVWLQLPRGRFTCSRR